MEEREEHSKKVSSAMVRSESGRVTSLREGECSKAPNPISRTPSEI